MTPQAPSWLNVTALTGIIVFSAMILLAITALIIMGRSGKGDMKKAASQMGAAFIGMVLLGLALGGALLWAVVQGTVKFLVNDSGGSIGPIP